MENRFGLIPKKKLFYAIGLLFLLLTYAIVVLFLPSYIFSSFFITEDMIPSPLVWLVSVILVELFVVFAIWFVLVDPIKNIDVIVMATASAVAANLLMLIGFLMRTLPRMVVLQFVLVVGFALYATYFYLVKLPRRTQETLEPQLTAILQMINFQDQVSNQQSQIPIH